MRITPARVLMFTAVAAFTVFCVVQDRVTAAGVQQYVVAQREAMDRGSVPVPIDSVMRPAVRQSVLRGAEWGGIVILSGVSGAAMIAARSRRG